MSVAANYRSFYCSAEIIFFSHPLTHCLLHGLHVANLPCLSLTRRQSLNYKKYKRRDTGTSESSVLGYMANWQQRTVIGADVRYSVASSIKRLRNCLPLKRVSRHLFNMNTTGSRQTTQIDQILNLLAYLEHILCPLTRFKAQGYG
jgi:hypothetical protein